MLELMPRLGRSLLLLGLGLHGDALDEATLAGLEAHEGGRARLVHAAKVVVDGDAQGGGADLA